MQCCCTNRSPSPAVPAASQSSGTGSGQLQSGAASTTASRAESQQPTSAPVYELDGLEEARRLRERFPAPASRFKMTHSFLPRASGVQSPLSEPVADPAVLRPLSLADLGLPVLAPTNDDHVRSRTPSLARPMALCRLARMTACSHSGFQPLLFRGPLMRTVVVAYALRTLVHRYFGHPSDHWLPLVRQALVTERPHESGTTWPA